MNRKLFLITLALLGCFLLLVGGVASAAPLPVAQPLAARLTGTLNIIWIDRQDGADGGQLFYLTTADGQTYELLSGSIPREELYSLNRQQVIVTTGTASPALNASANEMPPLTLESIRSVDVEQATDALTPSHPVLGNSRWVTIACKFADKPSEPYPTSIFQQMYADLYPGLNHYWREASYDQINLDGSTAVGWYTLPLNASDYLIAGNSVAKDCIYSADPDVFFPDYDGIIIVLNDNPFGAAWGGSIGNWTMDGVMRNYRFVAYPLARAWDHSVLQHEMGHAYGWPHSWASDNPYGDPWNVVSRNRHGCPHWILNVYDCIGQHPNTYDRFQAGWIPESRLFVADTGVHTITLERATLPGPDGYLLAIVPINGSLTHFYTVEARQKVGYDSKLPGDAVIIYEMGGQDVPQRLVDLSQYYEGSGESAMWKPGEAFGSLENDVIIRVDSATATGFEVTVFNGNTQQESAVLTPANDTYIRESTPTTNYGVETSLLLQGTSPKAWTALKFDDSLLPDAIVRMRLRMTITNGSSAMPGVAYTQRQSEDSTCWRGATWDELTLTWNSFPPYNCPNYQTDHKVLGEPMRSGDVVEWDLTAFGSRFGVGKVMLMESDSLIAFSSREGPNPPQLIIDYLVEPATTTTLTPTHDAFVKEANPTTNYGAAINLNVQDGAKDQRTFLKFDLGGVPAGISRATLRLYANIDAPQGGTVYPVAHTYSGTTTAWLESGLTWNRAPALSAAPLGVLGPVTGSQWVEVDVTAAAQTAQAAGPTLSLGLGGGSATRAAYSSKEGDHAPELVIETGSTPPPPEPITVTFTPTNDAHVQQANPNRVYGAAKTLRVRDAAKDINAYVKFNLAGVMGTIDRATLRLYVTDPGPDGGDVVAVSPTYAGTSTPWLDSGLTWANAPAISGAPLATVGPVTAKKWVEVDVTAAAAEAIGANNGRLSLALHNHSTNLVAYSSKEGTRPPELVVVYHE